MRLRAGTSGFSYKEWKGPFYPEKLPAKEMLGYYAGQLSTVEINNTFYRMPKPSMLEGWAEKVPDDFVFVLKASRKIAIEAQPWDEAFVFFKHEDEGAAPRLAKRLLALE